MVGLFANTSSVKKALREQLIAERRNVISSKIKFDICFVPFAVLIHLRCTNTEVLGPNCSQTNPNDTVRSFYSAARTNVYNFIENPKTERHCQ